MLQYRRFNRKPREFVQGHVRLLAHHALQEHTHQVPHSKTTCSDRLTASQLMSAAELLLGCSNNLVGQQPSGPTAPCMNPQVVTYTFIQAFTYTIQTTSHQKNQLILSPTLAARSLRYVAVRFIHILS